ncbi:hypothetical protein BDY24DRAFT_416207 [Mrakia frigida]|uniref:DUF6534 domain-containing protein n=1 Tax=Mrakia frigida TaxID=29902 RepID=UPI003FCBF0E1
MEGYDRTLGALVVASWLNSSLFTIEGIQIYEYFSRFRNDSWFNKACVCIALVSDIGGMVSVTASVYMYTITHFGDAVYAASQPWSIPLYGVSSGVSGAVAQTFLSLRIYRLTGQVAYPIAFGLMSAASLGGILATAVEVTSAAAVTYSDRAKLSNMVTLWLSCAAAVDICIAASLVFILSRTQISFKETGSLLRRLMLSAVKTGSITAGTAVIALVLFTWSPNDNLCVFFSLTLGRLYSITMLSNLNARSSDGVSGRGPSSGDGPGGRNHSRTGSGNMLGDATELKGVKVTSDTVTRVDRLEEEERRHDASIARSNRDAKKEYDNTSYEGGGEVPYEGSNHKDEWDDRSLEHSQVDLVEGGGLGRTTHGRS